MYLPLSVIAALFLAVVFFVWNFASRVALYNLLSISSQTAAFPTELAGTIDSLIKSLGIHAIVYVFLYTLASFSVVELPILILGTREFALSVVIFTWPIFFTRRLVYNAVIKAFKTPDWRDDSVTMVDILWRSAGVCQVLVYIFDWFAWVLSLFLG